MNYPLGVLLLACALLAHANSIRAAVISPGDILATAGITNGVTFNTTLYRVDPHTGDRTVVSDVGQPVLGINQVTTGGPSGGIFATSDASGGTVFRIDPSTGNRTIVSDSTHGSGPAFGHTPQAIAVAPDGTLFISEGAPALTIGDILKIDPTTGNRTLLLSNRVIYDLIVDQGRLLYTSTIGPDGIGSLDLATGTTSVFSSLVTGVGTGPGFSFPLGIVNDGLGHIVTTDNGGSKIFDVDAVTGDRTVLANLLQPSGIALAPNGHLVVAGHAGAQGLLDLDPVTGALTVLSRSASLGFPQVGSGPAFGGSLISVAVFVPEPASISLAAFGVVALLVTRRYHRWATNVRRPRVT